MRYMIRLLFLLIILVSCNTGKLDVIADLPSSLKEISAAETIVNSDLIWVIEDAGNKNNLYALNIKGKIIKDIDIKNSNNDDWEDLTSDSLGNIYIGDFGNNSENRKDFSIYKIESPATKTESTNAIKINFSLPKSMKSEDFEAFFLHNKSFYLFSKTHKKGVLLKVPNIEGNHIAQIVTDFELNGKHVPITSADISSDGKTVVLLNHDKLWKLTNYTSDNFFSGSIEEQEFEHDSQKEGICFKDNNSLYITDERSNNQGGNLYAFKLE